MADSDTTEMVFTKDGETRTATSAARAVALRYDGWTEQPAKKKTAASSGTDSPPK